MKTLTEQLLAIKATRLTSPTTSNPTSPEKQAMSDGEALTRQASMQRLRHSIPHRFSTTVLMRSGKCSACTGSIQIGKLAAICNYCQIMTCIKCMTSAPLHCGLPGGFAKQFGKNLRNSSESLSTLGGSVQTLAIDEPDNIPERVSND